VNSRLRPGLDLECEGGYGGSMPVRREVFLQNGIYHVYNRGNARRVVFKAKEDYERFLNRLKEFSASHEVAVLGYCLMPNHFHLLLMQVGEISLGEMMRKLLLAYAMYFNLKYDNVGSVFQGRFKAKMVGEDEYLLQVLRYIHQNPWELVQVKSPPRPRLRRAGGTWPGLKSYRWSSYPV
jgi:putative transposase